MKKILILGLGNFGHSWATGILPICADFATLVGVVDSNIETHRGIDPSVAKFTDLAMAIEQTEPDLVINVTPPHLHTPINKMILEKGIAVLCEKPIADTTENATEMVNFLDSYGGMVMIGENYRYNSIFRKFIVSLYMC